MSSYGQHQQQSSQYQLNPQANVFILVNLGCEMLYVIDQRLKAQQIAAEKSIQVIHDITTVLLESKFIDSLIMGSTHADAQVLTAEHCKFMLNDIATCSLMRLDDLSMDKLWNLMTVIYKWQLFVSRHQHHLLDITFRHLDSVNKLYPTAKRHMLIDFTKNTLLDFWNGCSDEQQLSIYRTNKAWLQSFNTKISLLIRLGFQEHDGTFCRHVNKSYFQNFAQSIGVNIYEIAAELAVQHKNESANATSTNHVDQLAGLLNITTTQNDGSGGDDLQPIDAKQFQQQFENNLQQCNILFKDLDVGSVANVAPNVNNSQITTTDFPVNLFGGTKVNAVNEFIPLETVYNRNADVSTTATSNRVSNTAAVLLNKQLLEMYNKID